MAAVHETHGLLDELAAACEAGADMDDLLALLQDRGLIEKDGGETVVVVEGDDEVDETRGPLRSIMARCRGNVAEGKLIAEWLLRLRGEQLELQEDAQDHLAAVLNQAQDWCRAQVEKSERKLDWINGLLEGFLRDADVPKMSLIGGKPTLTPCKPHKVWNEKMTLEWALALTDPDLATKRVIDKTKINDLIAETEHGTFATVDGGETVEFVAMVPPEWPDVFAVK